MSDGVLGDSYRIREDFEANTMIHNELGSLLWFVCQ